MEINERIKSLRESMRYSQYDMADKLNISQSAYLQIEKGKTELSISRLRQIADVLGVSQAYLLGIEQYEGGEKDQDKVTLLEKRVKELEDYLEVYKALFANMKEKEKQIGERLIWEVQKHILIAAFKNGILDDQKYKKWLLMVPIDEDEGPFVIDYLGLLDKNIDPDHFFLSKFLKCDEIVTCLLSLHHLPIVHDALYALNRLGLIDDAEVAQAANIFFAPLNMKRFKNPF